MKRSIPRSSGCRSSVLIATTLLLIAAAVAVGPTPPVAAAAPTGVTNLGLADSLGYRVAGDGFVAFTVDEAAQGVDLNGNGTAFDAAVWHVTGADGSTINLGLASPPAQKHAAAAGPGFVFAVDETAIGQDLNGDGDPNDPAVWHAYTPSSGVINIGLAAASNRVWKWGGGVAFHVHETAQGSTDLNGDGDSLDAVWHVYDWTAGSTNLGLAITAVLVGDDLTLGDGVLIWASEFFHGNTDLNGDGDATDNFVWHVWDPTGGVTNLQLAASDPVFRLCGSGVAFWVSEPIQGGVDLNGDGDSTDYKVWHVYRPGAGTTNLGLAQGTTAMSSSLDDGFLFTIGETAQGATDLNDDTDTTDDTVWHVYREGAGVTNLGLAGPANWVSLTDGLAFQVSEVAQQTDLNGDADATDVAVWHVYLTSSGVTNLGLATDVNIGEPVGDGFAFMVSEPLQGNTDLNGDTDTTDQRVLHVYDPAAGVVNVGLATGGSYFAAPDASFVFTVSETFHHNSDLNGDADTGDSVWHVYRTGAGYTNLGLASGFPVGVLAVGEGVVFTVAEPSQGWTDLNNDADNTDNGVWHHYHRADGVTNLQVAGNWGPGSFAAVAADGLITITVDEADQGGTDLNGDADTLDDVRHAIFFCSGRLPTWLGTPGPDVQAGSGADEVFVGLGGNDAIDGEGGADLVCGGPGADHLTGGAGLDVIYGGDGNDHLRGGARGDTLYGGDGADTLRGGAGDDRAYAGPDDDLIVDGRGDDIYDGGLGSDRLYFTTSPAGVTVNLGTGLATGNGTDTMTSIERLRGSRFDDSLTGDSGDNDLRAIAGDDTLRGGGGDDTLFGGTGDDRLIGGAGADNLYGQAGADVIRGSDGADHMFGSYGTDDLFGEGGPDYLFGRSGNDYLDGGPGTDELNGGLGTDTCINGEVYARCE